MKKLLFLFLILSLILYGCAKESEAVKEQSYIPNKVNKKTSYLPNYKNLRILEIEEGHIMIGPPATDPTASYPAYELFIEETTKVEGTKTSMSDLSEGDYVNVWTKVQGPANEIAEKIVVLN
ncbi:hypothetical protein B0H99_103170 [Planomicrobium soli]|uniref:DUF3221 domain-containing protein n=1 Tax=Planomicrobium soli TaxID=1176648 RepID=A0A2P8H482_9BACL|nr:hypothetical protein [Planomicrobium soli]PSL41036.1 hypothetical protein B0H99_103170 [Planomicrobium soli]